MLEMVVKHNMLLVLVDKGLRVNFGLFAEMGATPNLARSEPMTSCANAKLA